MNGTVNYPKKFNDLIDVQHRKIIDLPKEEQNLGQKASDWLTGFCGSWRFIFIVLIYIAIWITLNFLAWRWQWDPWPFIMLNLTLSCLAALQAPIILMSQNREAQRDRLNLRYDYLVDRKTNRDAEKILTDLKTLKNKLEKIEQKINQ